MDLQTAGASEIKMESVAERFESSVMKREAFTPDIAIHYIDLEKGTALFPSQELLSVVEKAQQCRESAEMMSDEEMSMDQMWRILCTPQSGKDFAKAFEEFTDTNRKNLEEKDFRSLITCLDKTETIINSILEPNGTQHT